MTKTYVVYRHHTDGIDWIVSAHSTAEQAAAQIECLQEEHEEKVKAAKELCKSGKMEAAFEAIWSEYSEEEQDRLPRSAEIDARLSEASEKLVAEYGFPSWGEYDYCRYYPATFKFVELDVEEEEEQ